MISDDWPSMKECMVDLTIIQTSRKKHHISANMDKAGGKFYSVLKLARRLCNYHICMFLMVSIAAMLLQFKPPAK